ncbi:MAG: transporter substrate-binding domain-containing protein, partial [Pseudomonadota bacterium]
MTEWRALALMMLLLLPGLVAAETVRVGGDHAYPPYEFINDRGEATGFNVDLIRAVGEIADFEPEFQLTPWSEARRAIASGDIDIVASFVADFRMDDMDFATPHLIVNHEIFVR